MNDPDAASRREEAEAWLSKAAVDRRAADWSLQAEPPMRSVAAFQCQQAMEKLLKGFLVLAATRFRKTHDLSALGTAVTQAFPDTRELFVKVEAWTEWNFAYRYPTDVPEPEPSISELREAIATIDRLSDMLRVATTR